MKPPRMRWTPEAIERVRDLAARGFTSAQITRLVGCSSGALGKIVGLHGIKTARLFHGKRHLTTEPIPGDWASAQLREEIEAARAEAATAPLYRGGWP